MTIFLSLFQLFLIWEQLQVLFWASPLSLFLSLSLLLCASSSRCYCKQNSAAGKNLFTGLKSRSNQAEQSWELLLRLPPPQHREQKRARKLCKQMEFMGAPRLMIVSDLDSTMVCLPTTHFPPPEISFCTSSKIFLLLYHPGIQYHLLATTEALSKIFLFWKKERKMRSWRKKAFVSQFLIFFPPVASWLPKGFWVSILPACLANPILAGYINEFVQTKFFCSKITMLELP